MTSKNNKRVYMRCPLCSRQPVAVKRGHIVSHLTPGGLRCSATGASDKILRHNVPQIVTFPGA